MNALTSTRSDPSGTRQRLIAAAARLMGEQGYAAVSAERLAKMVGLSRQSVHYHFGTIDDLLIEVLKFGFETWNNTLEEALSSDKPLSLLWTPDPGPAWRVQFFEFRAAALRNPALRKEIGLWYSKIRKLQIALVERHFEINKLCAKIPPAAASLLVPALMNEIAFEEEIGVSLHHDEINEFLREWVNKFSSGE